MIRKLKVKNYKSLKNVELELDKFNVLIGPNASGKSNLLDCLAFVSGIAQKDAKSCLIDRGGYDHIVFGGERGDIELSFEFTLNISHFNYFISVSAEGIRKEKLLIGDVEVIDRSLNKGKIKYLKEESGGSGYKEVTPGPWISVIFGYGVEFPQISPQIRETWEYLTSWRSYNFITSEMRRTYPAKRNLILNKNGGNLAQVLLSLHNERPKTFDKIENMLKQAIPQIDELLTPLTEGGETYVAMREKGFDSAFDYFQVSDGTLKLLAYITAIATEEPGLVGFEEPENFIHPRLFELLVEILKKSDKQIILSTHSPYLVDWIEPKDAIVVEKEKNETILTRIEDAEELKKHLEEIGVSFGEYWYSGGIGGVP